MTPEEAVANVDYCVFMDVLGYKSLLLDPRLGKDAQRLVHLVELWEALTVAIDLAKKHHPIDESKLFSDSLYASSGDLTPVVTYAARVFAQSYLYYETRDTNWMPWIRAGIGSGWLITVLDTTIAQFVSKPEHAFNNPAGPAIAHAHGLASDSCFKGMRLLIPSHLKTEAWSGMKHASHNGHDVMQEEARKLTSRTWPRAGATAAYGEIFDVPWWLLLDDGLPRDRIIKKHEWQAENSAAAHLHYKETLRLLQS